MLSTTERMIARAVTGLALLLLALGFIPSPSNCSLTARIKAEQGHGLARPLSLSVSAGQHRSELPVLEGQPPELYLSAADVSHYSMTLLWSDNSRSEFGTFSGCTALDRRSTDGRAKVSLAVR